MLWKPFRKLVPAITYSFLSPLLIKNIYGGRLSQWMPSTVKKPRCMFFFLVQMVTVRGDVSFPCLMYTELKRMNQSVNSLKAKWCQSRCSDKLNHESLQLVSLNIIEYQCRVFPNRKVWFQIYNENLIMWMFIKYKPYLINSIFDKCKLIHSFFTRNFRFLWVLKYPQNPNDRENVQGHEISNVSVNI